MRVGHGFAAAGSTHPGLQRGINEDRFHYDPTRGLLIVIDGVGGQAAGEKAAEAALTKIRERLESETGPVETRIRDAITSANNEVYRLGSLRPEWRGMACVLTVAVIDNGDAVVGHVGDTRLYKLRRGRIDKLTRDHSPVGEREDAGELTEAEAMRHPRRNEVYRDVGSEPHRPADPDFIDVFRVPFEPDAALLLCSDGLTDCVDSGTIKRIVEEYAGHAYEIVRALIDAANAAGGKDNVTVVYAEGSRFAEGEDTRDVARRRSAPSLEGNGPASRGAAASAQPEDETSTGFWTRTRVTTLVLLVAAIAATGAYATRSRWLPPVVVQSLAPAPREIVVRPGESIAAALAAANAGSEVIVEAGEYRERVRLIDGVRLRSRASRGATIRLPGGASEAEAAVVAFDVANAELVGFRIVGDAATPLGTGVFLRNSSVTIIDVEITGAQAAGIEFAAGAGGSLLASDLHDNPGVGVAVRSGAVSRLAHNTFFRNATSEHAAGQVLIEPGATFDLSSNVFPGPRLKAIVLPPETDASAIERRNWFVRTSDSRDVPTPRPVEQRRR
jgi:serine/threonine protein phosphatase PrpC